MARTSNFVFGRGREKGADDDLWRLGILLLTATQNKHNKNRKRVRNVANTLGDTLCTAGPLCGRCKVKNANSNTLEQCYLRKMICNSVCFFKYRTSYPIIQVANAAQMWRFQKTFHRYSSPSFHPYTRTDVAP